MGNSFLWVQFFTYSEQKTPRRAIGQIDAEEPAPSGEGTGEGIGGVRDRDRDTPGSSTGARWHWEPPPSGGMSPETMCWDGFPTRSLSVLLPEAGSAFPQPTRPPWQEMVPVLGFVKR